VKELNKLLLISILTSSIFLSLNPAKPALAGQPSVLNVIPWSNGGNTMLNVTVYHSPGEVGSHFVNNITVSVDGNVQYFSQSGPHTFYDSSNHFNVTVGPVTGVTGTPTAIVGAICSFNGPSEVNWTGQIPEFTLPLLLMAFVPCTFIAVFVMRKTNKHS